MLPDFSTLLTDVLVALSNFQTFNEIPVILLNKTHLNMNLVTSRGSQPPEKS